MYFALLAVDIDPLNPPHHSARRLSLLVVGAPSCLHIASRSLSYSSSVSVIAAAG